MMSCHSRWSPVTNSRGPNNVTIPIKSVPLKSDIFLNQKMGEILMVFWSYLREQIGEAEFLP